MIPNSFNEELLKQAAPVTSFLQTLGKVLGKTVPSALESVGGALRSAGLGNVNTARLVGAGVGAVGGAVTGSKVGDPENKGRNTLLGAAAGAAAGSFGGKALAPKVQSFGTAAGPALKALGNQMQSGKLKGGQDIMNYIAKNWSEKITPIAKGAVTPTTRPMLGAETKALGTVSKPAGSFLSGVAQVAQAGQSIADKGVIQGTKDIVKTDIGRTSIFNKTIDGKNYAFNRSTTGKIVNTALTSGVGMGALQAATVEGKDGEKPTIGKRLLSGGGTALAWGTAPKLTMSKMLAYDVPKTLIGMKKPKATDIPQQI